MQKLLVSLRNVLYRYFFQQINCSIALNVYVRALGLVFIAAIGAILFQYSDLILSDVVPDVASMKSSYLYLNVFRFISPLYFKFLLWVGLFLSFLLIIGCFPFWVLFYNVIIYSSLLVMFPTFMSFQWDILLIEITIFSLLFISPKILFVSPKQHYRVSWLQLLPIILLIVRLFYHSAVVKFLSKDPLWLSMSALDIHLFSQPMPHLLSYYFHSFVIKYNLSAPLLWVMFLIEFLIAFMILIPTYRRIAAVVLILFQCSIIFTGNYGFFNFLTIVMLLIPLLVSYDHARIRLTQTYKFLLLPIIVIITLNSFFMIPKPKHSLPVLTSVFKRLVICNNYGLFASMTRNQTRYQVSISSNGLTWTPLNFHYFDRLGFPTLSFVQPYHPRIRWQLWFKFLGKEIYPNWYRKFVKQMAKDPNQLSTIINTRSEYPVNNKYVRLCYQDILFDLDSDISDGSIYWDTNGPKSCHLYSYDRNEFTHYNPK